MKQFARSMMFLFGMPTLHCVSIAHACRKIGILVALRKVSATHSNVLQVTTHPSRAGRFATVAHLLCLRLRVGVHLYFFVHAFVSGLSFVVACADVCRVQRLIFIRRTSIKFIF